MSIIDEYVVAGTGSRRVQVADNAAKRQAWDLAVDRLQSALSVHPDLTVMSGGAEGWDYCLARAALTLRIPLWLALPNRGYGRHFWGRASVTKTDRYDEFRHLVAQATKVTYVMEEIHGTSQLYLNGVHSNFVRNTWMVRGGRDGFVGADDFLVWNDPISGGTKHCIDEIKKASKWHADMLIGLGASH